MTDLTQLIADIRARAEKATPLPYAVAPCHPMWSKQARGNDFENDCQERLADWAEND